MRKANSRRQDRAAQYGVKKPKHKQKPINATKISIIETELRNVRLEVSAIRVTATTERKTTSAIPARPVGNIENSRCTQRN